MKTLVLATGNKGKLEEMKAALEGVDVRVLGLGDYGQLPAVAETGTTFRENAEIKAIEYSRMTGETVLADDSGLAVDALGGAPGVFSARFAREGASDAENTAKLLKKIENFEGGERSACFVCEMAIAEPDGRIIFNASGRCAGRISRKPSGINGFGYDPVFVPEGFSATFGDLDPEIKRKISHRAAAMKEIVDFLGLFCGRAT